MIGKPNAPAAERNAAAILDVLRIEMAGVHSVLEIGSGTGQHAVVLGRELPHLDWQTSDRDENHAAICEWLRDAGLNNVREPLSFDVLTARVEANSYDAVFSANTAHIMSYPAVEQMFALVATALRDDGVFCLYGPFREGGEFNTDSNAQFHRSLLATNPEMGIRHLEDLDQLAEKGGMQRVRRYSMPANNLLVVWQAQTRSSDDGNS